MESSTALSYTVQELLWHKEQRVAVVKLKTEEEYTSRYCSVFLASDFIIGLQH